MLVFILNEVLVYSLGIATGIFFRNQISAIIKGALTWGRSKADEVEKKL